MQNPPLVLLFSLGDNWGIIQNMASKNGLTAGYPVLCIEEMLVYDRGDNSRLREDQ